MSDNKVINNIVFIKSPFRNTEIMASEITSPDLNDRKRINAYEVKDERGNVIFAAFDSDNLNELKEKHIINYYPGTDVMKDKAIISHKGDGYIQIERWDEYGRPTKISKQILTNLEEFELNTTYYYNEDNSFICITNRRGGYTEVVYHNSRGIIIGCSETYFNNKIYCWGDDLEGNKLKPTGEI